MAKIPCRKFTLADIMILVGFTAGGLAVGRFKLETGFLLSWWSVDMLTYGSSLLGCWTIAHLALRLKRPRPTLRRVFRQPGAAASLVALIALIVWILTVTTAAIFSDGPMLWTSLIFSAISVGPAISGAWTLLVITRTVRVEKGWIDRFGIALGIGWILLMLVVLREVFV